MGDRSGGQEHQGKVEEGVEERVYQRTNGKRRLKI
jgi:hypothetical protein